MSRAAVMMLLLLGACRQGMFNQHAYRAYDASAFFADGKAARRPVPGTVARGALRFDDAYREGLRDGAPMTGFPYPVSAAMLARGRERFDIFCAPCHGFAGDGDGLIVAHGFPAPPSYHEPRLRAAPVGHFVNVIARGYGVMYAYDARVAPPDRWAIAAYIRALQLSRRARVARLTAAVRSLAEEALP